MDRIARLVARVGVLCESSVTVGGLCGDSPHPKMTLCRVVLLRPMTVVPTVALLCRSWPNNQSALLCTLTLG